MLRSIISAGVLLDHLHIPVIIRLRGIITFMTVMMICHIGIHIRLIVIQINGFGLLVIAWPITIIIG